MLLGLKKNDDQIKQKLESWRDLDERKQLKEDEISTGLIIAGTGRWGEGFRSTERGRGRRKELEAMACAQI